jgi:hypothetical protein
MKTNARNTQKQTPKAAIRPVIRTPQKRAAMRAMLDLDLDPKPRGAWEGKLAGARGSAAAREVQLAIEMRVVGAVVEGEGRSPNFPKPQPGARFVMDGAMEDGVADMTLWFDNDLVSKTPFILSGVIDPDGMRISGSWTCGCFQPETCTCGGARGTFELKRVG